MMPRSFLDTVSTAQREGIQMMFGEASFTSSTKYLRMLCTERQGKPWQTQITRHTFEADGSIRAVKIVEALTAATRPEDLADAFAWFENKLKAQDAREQIQFIRDRARSLYGCTSSQGSVPVPTRALNTEVAYIMMDTLRLAFDIRLTGLRSATHLNGREGVIRGQNPTDEERLTARLDDGMCVSVRAVNIMHVRRGDYRRVSP
jgi:membrane peptidoglycan carboxypeptidase